MRNIRLDLCYDGTRYRGWQRLRDSSDTVQGKLEQTLSRILQEEIQINGSGRTDAGVHAMHQIASFHCQNPMSVAEMLDQMRRYLPEDIGVFSCREAEPRFHARLNAAGKTYCYRIWNSDTPCVFERRYCFIFPEKLDVDAMQSASRLLLGTHDYKAFCTRASEKKSTIRTIRNIAIIQTGDEIRISYTGNGFLYNMVRILTGTLIEIGQGSRSPETLAELFNGQRKDAGFLAPAKGLSLMEVLF